MSGVLFCTNPSVDTYEAFVTAEAKDFLVDDACTRSLPFIGQSLQDECTDFVRSERSTPLLRGMISRSSDRRNFVLFSLYSTQLDMETLMPSLPKGLLPSYRIDAIGLGNQFMVYSAQSL